jgi:hypothetical protein
MGRLVKWFHQMVESLMGETVDAERQEALLAELGY